MPGWTDVKTIFFLCTGNSCRSQMAEGFARELLSKDWQVYSAGVRADGLNKFAVQVMKEVGLDISKQTSKTIDALAGVVPDMVVTLCDNAKEQCPIYPEKTGRQHWSLPDPADAKGSIEEILAVYRKVRDEIRKKIRSLL